MRLKIATGFGIPVFVHWTFLLLPLLILWTRPNNSPIDLSQLFIGIPLIFGCVVLHEFGHALMARRFGIATQDVTLYPIGGVARLARMSEKPPEEMLIALAGPAVNVAIAIVMAAVLLPWAFSGDNHGQLFFVEQMAWGLLWFNVIMVPFNLLPAFPMDGGRVLRAMLALWLGHYQGTRVAVGVGMGMALLMGLGGAILLQNYMLAVIAAFIIFAGQQELLVARMREYQRQRWEDDEPVTVLPAWPNESVERVSQGSPLILQPRIDVYTWDQRTGTWNQEVGPL